MSKSQAKHQKALKRAEKLDKRAKSNLRLRKFVPGARPQDFSHQELFLENVHGTGYPFWRMHLLNFLASSLDDGIWNPLFPEIYPKEQTPATFPGEMVMHRRVLDRFLDPETQTLSDRGIQSILWMSLKAEEMYPMVWKVKSHIRQQGGDPHAPYDPVAWMVAVATGALIRQSCKDWDDLQSRTAQEYQQMFDETVKAAQDSLNQEFNGAAAAASRRWSRDGSPST